MGDAPEVIYVGADSEDGWRWPKASKFPMQHSSPVHAYVRMEVLPDQIDILRAIKKSGARKHGKIAKVVADLLKLKEASS